MKEASDQLSDQNEVKNKPGPIPKGIETITIEVQGKVVGRDNTVVAAEDVFKLAQIGCKDTEIADWFGIDPNTLRYNFAVFLIKGRESLKHSLRRKQIDVAIQGNPTMLIWLGKQYLQQSDSPQNENNSQPLPWSDEEDTAATQEEL